MPRRETAGVSEPSGRIKGVCSVLMEVCGRQKNGIIIKGTLIIP